jgi:S-adenosylmethionine:tRNA ribosyltransferase-isomerase
MRTDDFDFVLPQELIAQTPLTARDDSRLLVLHRTSREISHRHFQDLLEYLRPGDVLVLNDSRVIPARLRGNNAHTGGQFELLLLEELAANDWWAMLRPGKRARVGTQILIQDLAGRSSGVTATVQEKNEEGHRRLRFDGTENIRERLDALGEVPLPPYINRKDLREMETDRERYQTVFAQPAGSIAAPTAGLHFTGSLLDRIRSLGIQTCFVTLHVGLGTFAPVKASTITDHVMHEERFEVPLETARLINDAKKNQRRVIAVGTTTLRVLESLAAMRSITPALHQSISLKPGPGKTRIFIYPPCDFKIADALLTNFHLPRSTLLMLASAFAAPNETTGSDLILSAYAEATLC